MVTPRATVRPSAPPPMGAARAATPPRPPKVVVYKVPPDERRAKQHEAMTTGWLLSSTAVGTLAPVALVLLAMTAHSQLDVASPSTSAARGMYIGVAAAATVVLLVGVWFAARWHAHLSWLGFILGAGLFLVADYELREYGDDYTRAAASLIVGIVVAVLVGVVQPILNAWRRGPHPVTPAASTLIAYGSAFLAVAIVLLANLDREAQKAAASERATDFPAIGFLLAAIAASALAARRRRRA